MEKVAQNDDKYVRFYFYTQVPGHPVHKNLISSYTPNTCVKYILNTTIMIGDEIGLEILSQHKMRMNIN